MKPSDDEMREYGAVIQLWVVTNRSRFTSAMLTGPLDAPGMDPTWILELESDHGTASAFLFRGPYVDLGWARAKDTQASVAGHEGFAPSDLASILDTLAASIGSELNPD